MKKSIIYTAIALFGLSQPLQAAHMPVFIPNPETIPAFLDTARVNSWYLSTMYEGVRKEGSEYTDRVKKIKKAALTKEVEMPALRLGRNAGARGRLVKTQVKYVTTVEGVWGPHITIKQRLPGVQKPRVVSGFVDGYLNSKGALRYILKNVKAPFVDMSTVAKGWRADKAFVHYFRRALWAVVRK